jgi:hybrid cluster-associated redox disulfide protein
VNFTKEMTIKEALEVNTKSAEIFMSFGMHCIGCPTATGESIAQAAMVHGINVDLLLEKLNAL